MEVRNGVRSVDLDNGRKQQYQNVLPTVALARNVLKLPLSVLNAKSVWIDGPLETQWKDSETNKLVRFSFSRPTEVPFPNPRHSRFLDILLMMFASKFNKEGVLAFKFSHVLENAGLSKNNRGGRQSILETIFRYRKCLGDWDYSESSRIKAWSGPIITFCDIWNDDEKLSLNNPRNSQNAKSWHHITFHPKIVEALDNDLVKIFFSEVFRNKLTPEELIVYKHFFGLVDNSEIKRSLESIRTSIAYQSSRTKFKEWIKVKCESLVRKSMFEYFKIDHDVISVWSETKFMPLQLSFFHRG